MTINGLKLPECANLPANTDTEQKRKQIAQAVFELLEIEKPNLRLKVYSDFETSSEIEENSEYVVIPGLGAITWEEIEKEQERYSKAINEFKNDRKKYVSDEFIMNFVKLNNLKEIEKLAKVLGIQEEIKSYTYESINTNWLQITFVLESDSILTQDFLIIFNNKRSPKRPLAKYKNKITNIQLEQFSLPFEN